MSVCGVPHPRSPLTHTHTCTKEAGGWTLESFAWSYGRGRRLALGALGALPNLGDFEVGISDLDVSARAPRDAANILSVQSPELHALGLECHVPALVSRVVPDKVSLLVEHFQFAVVFLHEEDRLVHLRAVLGTRHLLCVLVDEDGNSSEPAKR
eukprot:2146293-Prymnesium_polylepis.1